ncbi:NCS2 family permease N-terminal domain protein [Candidatus Hepatincolaceae symbiont of Richtersius coronifer]
MGNFFSNKASNKTSEVRLKAGLDSLFQLKKNNTSLKVEIYAGLVTFLTMSYIIFVNPLILKPAGIDIGAVFIAICLVSAIGAFMMAFYANLPLAIAPGMGLNALFAYTIVLQMGYSWENALAITFLAGIVIIAIALFAPKDFLITAVPLSIKYAITPGIGMFIIFIALTQAKIIVPNAATVVSLGNLKDPRILMVIAGFFIIVVGYAKKIYFMPLLVITLLTIVAVLMKETKFDQLLSTSFNL